MRRESFWFGLAETTTVLAVATPVLFTGLPAGVLPLRPFTIVRTRGVVYLSSDQIANTERYFAVWAAAVVSDEALAVGVTAVPTPVDNPASDLWFMYEALAGSISVSSAIGSSEPAGVFKEYDSRAMRKVEEGQDVAFVEEASGATGFSGCNMTKQGRMLIKLH